ncbi:MAG TPA: hypothetical protein VLF60_00990 [Candidatus Saccharimonadales bacterium]|nr:hypothetical protein [Candidatus Saccharimonadales bacterium]
MTDATSEGKLLSHTLNEDSELHNVMQALPDEALMGFVEGDENAPNVIHAKDPEEFRVLIRQATELLPFNTPEDREAAAEKTFMHEMAHAQVALDAPTPSGHPPLKVVYKVGVFRGKIKGEEQILVSPTVQPVGIMRKIDFARMGVAPQEPSTYDLANLRSLGYESSEELVSKLAELKEKYIEPSEAHTMLSGCLLAHEQENFYFSGTIGNEEVSVRSFSNAVTSDANEAITQHSASLEEGRAVVSAVFRCAPGEIDALGNSIRAYRYLSAPPSELDAEYHAGQLAAFFRTTTDEYYIALDAVRDATGRPPTVEELRTRLHKEDLPLTTPVTFANTLLADHTDYQEVLFEDGTQSHHHQRLKALQNVLTSRTGE